MSKAMPIVLTTFQGCVSYRIEPAGSRPLSPWLFSLIIPGCRGPRESGADALKTLAISRLYLDNFRHIKAYWVMLGMKVSQVALAFGVNDIDGTVVEEQIGHDAGADSPQQLSKEQLVGLIHKAGKQPVERDTLYNEIKTY